MKRAALAGIALVAAAGLAVVLLGSGGDGDASPARGPGAVPASIASDCSKNVEVELSRFINAQPEGTRVQFPRNGCYAQGARIEVRDRRNLTIDGNGSSFKSTAPNSGLKVNPNWLILRGRGVRMTDMKIVGNFHLKGKRSQKRVADDTVAGVGNAFNMGVGIYGGIDNHVTDMTIRDVFGDGVTTAVAHYLDGPDGQPLNSPRNVHIERVKVTKAARHCFSPSQAVGFWLEDSEARDCWYGAFDAELDNVEQKLQDLHLLRNTFADFNLFGIVIPVAGNGDNTRDIEIRDNKFLTPPDVICNNVIEVGLYPTNPNMIKNVVVEGNAMKTHGVAVVFDHVDGGSIRGNDIEHDDKNCQYPKKTPPVLVSNSARVTVQGNRVRG